MDLNVRRSGEYRRHRICVARIHRGDELIEIRFRHASDAIEARANHHRRQIRKQSRQTLLFEHRLHFFGWAGQHRNDSSVDAKPLPGRGASVVRQDLRPVDHLGLSKIHLNHAPVETSETFLDRFANRFGERLCAPERSGDRIAGNVVFRWSQSAGNEDDFGVSQARGRGDSPNEADRRRRCISQPLRCRGVELICQITASSCQSSPESASPSRLQ